MADKLVSKKVAEEIREEVKNVGEKNDDDETVGPKKRSNTHTYDQNNKRRKINPKSDGAGGENQRLHGWGTGSGSITKPQVGPLAPHPCSPKPKPAFGEATQTPKRKRAQSKCGVEDDEKEPTKLKTSKIKNYLIKVENIEEDKKEVKIDQKDPPDHKNEDTNSEKIDQIHS